MSIPQTAIDRLVKQLLTAQATAAKFRVTDARGGYIGLATWLADRRLTEWSIWPVRRIERSNPDEE